MEYRRKFSLAAYTPDGPAFSMDVVSAQLPGDDGLIGVLGNRAPLISLLGAGRLALQDVKGAQHEYYLAVGFAQVCENVMTVLAEECIEVSQIDREQAWEEISRARKMPVETDDQRQRRRQAVAAARAKFRLAQEHWRARRKGEVTDMSLE